MSPQHLDGSDFAAAVVDMFAKRGQWDALRRAGMEFVEKERNWKVSVARYQPVYERLLGADVRPWLPSAFCAAAALPQIRPECRKELLQSLSEAAATAPGWSDREPAFYPEYIEAAEAA